MQLFGESKWVQRQITSNACKQTNCKRCQIYSHQTAKQPSNKPTNHPKQSMGNAKNKSRLATTTAIMTLFSERSSQIAEITRILSWQWTPKRPNGEQQSFRTILQFSPILFIDGLRISDNANNNNINDPTANMSLSIVLIVYLNCWFARKKICAELWRCCTAFAFSLLVPIRTYIYSDGNPSAGADSGAAAAAGVVTVTVTVALAETFKLQ